MDLRSTVSEQISDLIDWMLDQADMDTPSAVQHQERCLGLKERAWFLKEIVLPKIPTQKIAMAALDGVTAERPDGLGRVNGFLRGKGPNTEALMGISSDSPESPSGINENAN